MKALRLLASVTALALVPALATAQQTCTATLGATWDPVNSALGVSLTGAPANSPTMTFLGLTQGTTTMMGVTLGLSMPFHGIFFGFTDANGAFSATRTIPNAPSGLTVYLQNATLDMSGGHGGGGGMGGGMGGGQGHMAMTVCVSNVVPIVFP